MAAKKFTRITGAMQATALQLTEPDRLFGGSRQGMRFVEPRIEDVDLNPQQPRRHFDPEALNALADSIAQHGQKQPIGVQMQDNGRWLLVFGERRLRACRQNGLPTIQAVVTEGDPLEIALIENLQREDLSLFETADAYARLMERQGYNRSTLARVVGASPTAITRLMALLDIPADLRAEMEGHAGGVAKSLLLELAEIADPASRRVAWTAVKNGATVRELRALKAADRGESPSPIADSQPDQMSEKLPIDDPADSLEKSVKRLEKLVKPYREGRLTLQIQQRNRLTVLRDLIDQLLSGD